MDAALGVARRTEQLLQEVDAEDADWSRVQATFSHDYSELLRSLTALGHQAQAETSDFGMIVTIVYQNRAQRPDLIEASILDEIIQRRELLTARETEVLENHLQAEVAAAIQRILHEAEARLQAINGELAKRPTLVATLRGLGMLKRLTAGDAAGAMRLGAEAGLVLERLPAGTVTRSQLAASSLGDAHALDLGRPVATLVLAALRMQRREGETEAGQEDSDRSVWATAGVLVNELARPVLFLNLPTATGVHGRRRTNISLPARTAARYARLARRRAPGLCLREPGRRRDCR